MRSAFPSGVVDYYSANSYVNSQVTSTRCGSYAELYDEAKACAVRRRAEMNEYRYQQMLVTLSPLVSEKVIQMSDFCGFDVAWVKKPVKGNPAAAPSKAQPLPLTSAPAPFAIVDITDLPSQPAQVTPPARLSPPAQFTTTDLPPRPVLPPPAQFAPLAGLAPPALLPLPAQLAPRAELAPATIQPKLARPSIQTRLTDLVKATAPVVGTTPLAAVPIEPGTVTGGENAE